MLKKTLAIIGVASLAGAGAMEVLPEASAKSLCQYDGVQLAQCSPCAAKKVSNPCNPCAAKKACNPCNPCAAKKVCNPCNPCAAKKANPCGT